MSLPNPRPKKAPLLVLFIAMVTVSTAALPVVHAQPRAVPCHDAIQAEPRPNEDIRVEWTPVAEADLYQIVRVQGGDLDTVEVFTTTEPRFHDTNTTVGETYRYSVIPSLEDERFIVTEDCPTAEATAIPYFTGSLLVLLGAAGALVGYGVWTRRMR